MTVSTDFGPMLRTLRVGAHLSQQRLAEQAEVSARHLSFLETGRAQPSREMVLVLANALELPLRERNTMLAAAGFAPVYRESPLEGERMAGVRRALDHLLTAQEPYGAVVVDRAWNVRQMNQGAMRLLAFFMADATDPRATRNVMHAVFDPNGLRPFIVGWEAMAGVLIDRLHRETVGPAGSETRALIDELLAYPDIPERFARPDLGQIPDPFMALHLRKGEAELRLFTIVSTLGTPIDVTAEELRIESYFPADEASDRFIRALAS